MTAVREVAASEFDAAGRTLSLAFEDDPVMQFLFPDPGSRLRRLRSFYRVAIPMIAGHGALHADEALHAAAVWQAPSPPHPGRWAQAWTALRMLASLREAVGRGNALHETVQPAHVCEPHWYLSILGTEPGYQGRGLGSALLAQTLERCDRDGSLAYLESSKEQNIPFYERHGFKVTDELQVPGGPRLWPMLRRPRGAES